MHLIQYTQSETAAMVPSLVIYLLLAECVSVLWIWTVYSHCSIGAPWASDWWGPGVHHHLYGERAEEEEEEEIQSVGPPMHIHWLHLSGTVCVCLCKWDKGRWWEQWRKKWGEGLYCNLLDLYSYIWELVLCQLCDRLCTFNYPLCNLTGNCTRLPAIRLDSRIRQD